MKQTLPARTLDIGHVFAGIGGVVCFAVVFMCTGASDLLFAVSRGLAVSALFYLAANITVTLRNPGS